MHRHERLVGLLHGHKVRIARALVRQMRALSPRYAGLEPIALEQNLVRLLGLVARFLETGDDSSLKNHSAHTAQLRAALGFRVADFMTAALCFLPVLRRFLLDNAPTLKDGIDDYEALEAVAIPLLADAASLFNTASEDDDEVTAPSLPRLSSMSSFSVERVTGSADEELGPWNL